MRICLDKVISVPIIFEPNYKWKFILITIYFCDMLNAAIFSSEGFFSLLHYFLFLSPTRSRDIIIPDMIFDIRFCLNVILTFFWLYFWRLLVSHLSPVTSIAFRALSFVSFPSFGGTRSGFTIIGTRH